MLKNIFIIFFCFLTYSVAMAQKVPPKSGAMAILNHPDYDTHFENSPVITSLLVGCASAVDAVNYTCYYGKKWFGTKPAPGNGVRTLPQGALPAWATPSATPTAFSDIAANRRPVATVATDRSASSSASVTTADTSTECEWDMSRPPRIIKAPGCSSAGKCLCQGRVICGNKSRIAVCSESFCKDGAATACAKQLRYSSRVVN